jgi:hypothetical protein
MSYSAPSVVASGTTFAQLQAGGLSGHLELLISAQGATLAPTVAATASATGGGSSGGTLAAGTYYFVVTELNGLGETTAGPESAQLTVSAGNKPRITFQSLKSGNVARNVYLSALNSASGGPYYLYASNVTASTVDLLTAVGTNSYAVQNPPTVNTTGLTYTDGNGNGHNKKLELLRAAKDGNFQDTYNYLRMAVYDFLHGSPMTFNGSVMRIRDAHAVFAMLATLCTEVGTLVDANPGTITVGTDTIGLSRKKRTFP